MVDPLSRTTPARDPQASGIGQGSLRAKSPLPKGERSLNNTSAATTPRRLAEGEDGEEEKKGAGGGNVAVYCRFRPYNKKETEMGEQ